MSHLSVVSSPVKSIWYYQVRVSVLSHTGDYPALTNHGIVACVVLSLSYNWPVYVLLTVGMTVKCSVSLSGICLEAVQKILQP